MAFSEIKSIAGNLFRHGLAHATELAGAEKKFCIRGAYKHRVETIHFDDTGFTDEHQKEVYLRAADIARNNAVKTIYDIGCRSGYKLINYLGGYDTTGFDVPQTVEFLHRANQIGNGPPRRFLTVHILWRIS